MITAWTCSISGLVQKTSHCQLYHFSWCWWSSLCGITPGRSFSQRHIELGPDLSYWNKHQSQSSNASNVVKFQLTFTYSSKEEIYSRRLALKWTYVMNSQALNWHIIIKNEYVLKFFRDLSETCKYTQPKLRSGPRSSEGKVFCFMWSSNISKRMRELLKCVCVIVPRVISQELTTVSVSKNSANKLTQGN